VIADRDAVPEATRNLETVRGVPLLFALLMGLMAIAVLTHVLWSATRTHRKDHAVLRALGFSHRQTRGVLRYEALVYVAVGLVVGVPAGAVIGRFAWRAYAENLGVVPAAVVPWREFAVAALGLLVLALLAAVVPAWRASHLRTADVLRRE
jgi:ABC-type lipoprotein release transport system permease subunit